MPYIESENDRFDLDEVIDLYSELLKKKGNLNYFLCRLFLEMDKMSYEHTRNFFGEVDCALREIYRRWVIPYEEEKMKEHGDVL